MTSLDRWWLTMFKRMLDLEEREGVDPERLANRWLVLDLHANRVRRRPRWSVSFDVPEPVAHFLADPDVRAKDRAYAEHQWAAAREWLNA